MNPPRRKHLTIEERELVLKVDNYFNREKENGGPLVPVLAVQQRTTSLCGISRRTLANLRKMDKECQIGKQNKRRRLHSKTLDLPNEVKHTIKQVVYDMYKDKEVVTRASLLNKLREKQICNIGKTSLSTLLNHLGFKFKKTDNRKILCEQSSVVTKRWKFLRNYIENLKSDNPRQVVFLDETWIFAKGTGTKYTWQDGTEKCYSNVSTSSGKRYIVVHAGNREGFLPNASLVFASTANQSDDYHKSMNSEVFEEWFEEKVLKILEEPSLIILDNAPYHSRLTEKIPNSNSCKDDIRKWLNEKNIENEHIYLKAELLSKVREYRCRNEKLYMIDALAQQYGHLVLRLPPYHCQFNPIEMVWGICKNFYDKHASKTTDQTSVLNLWNEALNQVNKETWEKCILHVEKLIQNSYATEQVIDEIRPIIINLKENSDDSDNETESSESE